MTLLVRSKVGLEGFGEEPVASLTSRPKAISHVSFTSTKPISSIGYLTFFQHVNFKRSEKRFQEGRLLLSSSFISTQSSREKEMSNASTIILLKRRCDTGNYARTTTSRGHSSLHALHASTPSPISSTATANSKIILNLSLPLHASMHKT